jgi:hypothetical protein
MQGCPPIIRQTVQIPHIIPEVSVYVNSHPGHHFPYSSKSTYKVRADYGPHLLFYSDFITCVLGYDDTLFQGKVISAFGGMPQHYDMAALDTWLLDDLPVSVLSSQHEKHLERSSNR